MNKKPFHHGIRFSDTMFAVGDVVAIHNSISEDNGSVWFGKLGQTISQIRVDLLNKQVEDGKTTYLYLIKGNRKKSSAYRATLRQVQKEKPEDNRLIPTYYTEKDIIQYMKAWFRIEHINKIEMSDMGNLKTINSVFPIAETLRRSSSGHFLVHESKAIF